MAKYSLILFCMFFSVFSRAADGWHDSYIDNYAVYFDKRIYVNLNTPISSPNCEDLYTVVFSKTNPNYDAALSSIMLAYTTGKKFGVFVGSNAEGDKCTGNIHNGRAVRVSN